MSEWRLHTTMVHPLRPLHSFHMCARVKCEIKRLNYFILNFMPHEMCANLKNVFFSQNQLFFKSHGTKLFTICVSTHVVCSHEVVEMFVVGKVAVLWQDGGDGCGEGVDGGGGDFCCGGDGCAGAARFLLDVRDDGDG